MSQLRINDNSSGPVSLFEQNIPLLTKTIANKTFDQLERENIFVFPELSDRFEDISADKMILKQVNSHYHTGNVMGFLGKGDERLAIQSRFSENDNDFFLQYLLEKVLEYPNVFDLEINADPKKKILDMLVFLFPRCLQDAMRKGLFKAYIRTNYNDSNPKGTIDIARHIKENVPFVGNIAYSQREYSYDNYLIELIRHTIEFIKLKPYGKTLLNKARDEVHRVVEATPKFRTQDRRKVLTENQKHPIRHAYFYEYRYLQRLCILILQNQKQGIGIDKRRVYGILFDGAWLWEEYVNTLVSSHFHHPENKSRKLEHYLFQGTNGRIFPDFIGKDESNRIIADAKYKPYSNIHGDDYLQVLAYMLRFDAKLGFYFYPESEGRSGKARFDLQSGSRYDKTKAPSRNDDVTVYKLGLTIPDNADTYEDFCKSMKSFEKDFLNSFEGLIP